MRSLVQQSSTVLHKGNSQSPEEAMKLKALDVRHLLIRSTLLIAILMAMSNVLPVKAQQAATSAILSGSVEDASGAAVGGATIIASNLETNQCRRIETDGEGRYRFSYLPVGTYRVVVEHEGFSTLIKQVTLTGFAQIFRWYE